ncbi:Hypothetical protein SMAX5B_008040 [Scophthalmus maximus]|uniref:Uncharacterized protein n=1 Tax=Scophthalmus maximus TaxID=52904 RepID=A0A2U9BE32_SCOMX|nr:Hypothetical protein SMAX5B_008040 [Scophthalmus maximus]
MVRSANEDACLHASTYKSTTSAEWGILRSVDTFKLSLLPRFPNRAGRAGECLVRIRRPDRFVRTVEEIRLKRGSSELQSKSTTGHVRQSSQISRQPISQSSVCGSENLKWDHGFCLRAAIRKKNNDLLTCDGHVQILFSG